MDATHPFWDTLLPVPTNWLIYLKVKKPLIFIENECYPYKIAHLYQNNTFLCTIASFCLPTATGRQFPEIPVRQINIQPSYSPHGKSSSLYAAGSTSSTWLLICMLFFISEITAHLFMVQQQNTKRPI